VALFRHITVLSGSDAPACAPGRLGVQGWQMRGTRHTSANKMPPEHALGFVSGPYHSHGTGMPKCMTTGQNRCRGMDLPSDRAIETRWQTTGFKSAAQPEIRPRPAADAARSARYMKQIPSKMGLTAAIRPPSEPKRHLFQVVPNLRISFPILVPCGQPQAQRFSGPFDTK